MINVLQSNKWIRWMRRKLKTTSLPGLGSIPIYHIAVFIYKESVNQDIVTRANSAAYSFFLSLFPFLLLVISVGTLFPFDIIEWMRSALEGLLPNSAESFLFQFIGNLEELPQGGILSLGFILVIYFSSAGISTLMRGFHKGYSLTFKERHWIWEQLIAILLTAIVFILILLSTVLLISGNYIVGLLTEYISLDGFETFMLQLLKWILVVSLFYATIALIYKLGPAMHRKFRFFSPGATVSTFVIIVLTYAFGIYVNNFGTYNKLYGSIGAIIVLLVWMKLVCTIVLLGFELNASIAVNRDLRKSRIPLTD